MKFIGDRLFEKISAPPLFTTVIVKVPNPQRFGPRAVNKNVSDFLKKIFLKEVDEEVVSPIEDYSTSSDRERGRSQQPYQR